MVMGPAKALACQALPNRLSLLYGNKAKFEIKQASASLVEARVLIPVEADY